MGNSEDRLLPVAIVDFVYYPVTIDENTQVIFVLGQRFSISRSRVVREPDLRNRTVRRLSMRDCPRRRNPGVPYGLRRASPASQRISPLHGSSKRRTAGTSPMVRTSANARI